MTTETTSAHEILQRLDNEVLIFDGATGTYLQQHGLESGGCPELMNADAPDTIRQMARDYFDAGADLVLTNTFGGTKFRLQHYDAQDRVSELNSLAAEHAKSQAGPSQFVAGSVGPDRRIHRTARTSLGTRDVPTPLPSRLSPSNKAVPTPL